MQRPEGTSEVHSARIVRCPSSGLVRTRVLEQGIWGNTGGLIFFACMSTGLLYLSAVVLLHDALCLDQPHARPPHPPTVTAQATLLKARRKNTQASATSHILHLPAILYVLSINADTGAVSARDSPTDTRLKNPPPACLPTTSSAAATACRPTPPTAAVTSIGPPLRPPLSPKTMTAVTRHWRANPARQSPAGAAAPSDSCARAPNPNQRHRATLFFFLKERPHEEESRSSRRHEPEE